MRQDTRLVNFLGEVDEAQALAALNEYHAAVSETSVNIRNKPAYLMGILRKYKQGQRAPLGNGTAGGMVTTPNAMGRMGAGTDGLSPSIASRLEKLYESGFIQKADVDQRCMVFFRDLTEKEAEAAMDEFGQSDITSIRNKSAFLMSILRRHHQDFYGGMYGHAPPMPLFNAYGQPMATFIPPHMPMYQAGTTEMLPASIQLRLDQLAATGFCHAGEIDDRCRKFLREVPEHIALQAIEEFMSTERKNIRKVSAYLMGVIRKHADNYRGFVAVGTSGGPPAGLPSPYEAGLKRIREYNDFWAKQQQPRPQGGSALLERIAGAPAKVQAGITDLIEKGIAMEWDIDVRVTNAFLGLTEEQGVEAIEEFASCDMTRIRNKSAYLMGLLKRYKSGAPPPPGLAQR
ncbi:conserved unknown protein [Ectocarpus siliculosus]|uniref:Heterogeneous nuclear ribonucleoprotein Q acidic domain-containing protein n=1 Tax=Ectocarpus siliculosus TaxID=2880 RepID=D8LG90_ECTSI|nr:conserved unknown protein [Ectocarpus siliculosus]|eukprot:CBN78989.1 conserved unknown protein [Ectocarpus siliculosus]